ncbi:MAG: HNH endonuclease [Thermoleophilaceae bacterium]
MTPPRKLCAIAGCPQLVPSGTTRCRTHRRKQHGPDRGGRPWRRLRAQIIDRDGGCVVCGTSHQLEVHHRDGDRTNNNPANLMTVGIEHHPR